MKKKTSIYNHIYNKVYIEKYAYFCAQIKDTDIKCKKT